MSHEVLELLSFLRVLGDIFGAAATIAMLPVLAFLIWLVLPKQA